MRRVGVLAATGLAIGAVAGLTGRRGTRGRRSVCLRRSGNLAEGPARPAKRQRPCKRSCPSAAGPGLDLINPEAATAAVRFTLPSGISVRGARPARFDGGMRSHADDRDLLLASRADPRSEQHQVGAGISTAAAPGTYVFTAELMRVLERRCRLLEQSCHADYRRQRRPDAPVVERAAEAAEAAGLPPSRRARRSSLPRSRRPERALTAVVNVSASGAPVRPSDVGCAGKVGTVSLRGIGTARSGTASCLFRTPLSAKGKTVARFRLLHRSRHEVHEAVLGATRLAESAPRRPRASRPRPHRSSAALGRRAPSGRGSRSRAPAPRAGARRPARPRARSRRRASSRAPRASWVARSIAPAGKSSPKSTTPGLSASPQCGHVGTGLAASCASTASAGSLQRQPRHCADRIDPCTSTTSSLPARLWSVSMFCVTTAWTRPLRSSSASARCAAFGSASRSRSIRSR